MTRTASRNRPSRPLAAAALAAALAAPAVLAPRPLRAGPGEPIALWPDGVPQEGLAPGQSAGADPAGGPTLTPYLPAAEKATGAAVVVCPGGGYGTLADHEGRPVAEWLNAIGAAGFVLRYRHAPRWMHPAPLADASRAMRIVRSRAAEWGIRPDRIGILGFSAGGHLASSAGTHFDAGRSGAADPVERASCRPDFMVLVYPVITMGAATHGGSRRNLLGPEPKPELLELMSSEKQVTGDTPPTFLVHTADDGAVPVANSLLLAEALGKAGVPFELHVFGHGPHGFGLGGSDPVLSSWPGLCAAWLKARGILVPGAAK